MRPIAVNLLALGVGLWAAHPQVPSPDPQLLLESRGDSLDLTVSGLPESGALFVYRAGDLTALADGPALVLGTNVPSGLDLRVPVSPAEGTGTPTFFSAELWPGHSTGDFGEPETYPDLPPPDRILVTSGIPDEWVAGQPFTVDFFLINPEGELLDVTQAVTIRVVRSSDGAEHPDARVVPGSGPMVGGHLRLTLTLSATEPLGGYLLGIGPGSAASLRSGQSPAASVSEFLRAAFNLGPAPLSVPTRDGLLQVLEKRRTDHADVGPAWGYPLGGAGHPVSGTFGEWRGRGNTDVHRGLDLAAGAGTGVLASRGGVVSHRGSLPGMGDYLVMDHGQGWFSRYLHLDAGAVSVAVGQPVARGQTLATRLHAAGAWPQHLHFEIRRGGGTSQWGVGLPGAGQDPLQTPGMFGVAPGSDLPVVREFGVTRRHPGQNAFAKSPPTTDAPGAVYVFARMLDPEAGRRLGLRALRFLPEAPADPLEIRPGNDPSIASLLPPGGAEKGFARYSGTHAANPNPANYFRYWWRWATAGYAEDRRGPRALLLTGEDHAPSARSFPFTFGPQVEGDALTPVGPGQYEFTQVAHLGTNTPAGLGNPDLFVQPDQYTLEILGPDQQPLSGVTWSGPVTDGRTRVFTRHLEKEVFSFRLPAGTGPTGWKLRVSSRLVPDIAHEVCLCSGTNLSYIPGGAFVMGDTLNDRPGSLEQPVHSVYVSAFCMEQHEVTKALWDHVANWAVAHGYRFDWPDSGSGRAPDHPVQTTTWFDALKWCNARSEMEGRVPAYYTDVDQTTVYRTGQIHIHNGGVKWRAGYRLPTEAEWEKGARGGAEGVRFPWGATISWAEANYSAGPLNDEYFDYDVSGGKGYHPEFGGGPVRTSPVGHFQPNGYGLFDMSGNVWELCWDWLGRYSDAASSDPQGAPFGSQRVIRGGGWAAFAKHCRVAYRGLEWLPYRAGPDVGFRTVLPAGR